MFLQLKQGTAACTVAAVLTYVSLVVPGRGITLCGNIGTPFNCEVLAYGFPLPFLADSRALSPTGSVGRDPLSLLIGEDDVLWPQLGLTAAYWLLVVIISRAVRPRWRRQPNSN